jgi:hypothetical protein
MKKIKFEETIVVKNIKIQTKSIMDQINKVPSCSILDEKRSVSKTDCLVIDYSQKIYGIKFFESIKNYVKEFGKLKNHAEIRISNYCFIKMKNEDQLDYHSSFESNFVGIFLLENSSKKEHILFYDNEKNKEVSIKLSKRDLIMFPSYLLRKFPNLKSKKQYTYILFDFHLDKAAIYGKK